MARIRVLPSGIEFDVPADATVMGAATAAGYYWPTTCGGEARCTTCACEILEGADILPPRGRAEERALVAERGPAVLNTAVRLACQLRAGSAGSVLLRKAGVRAAGDVPELR